MRWTYFVEKLQQPDRVRVRASAVVETREERDVGLVLRLDVLPSALSEAYFDDAVL